MKPKFLIFQITFLLIYICMNLQANAQNCSGFQAVISKNDISCNGINDGKAFVSVTGGKAPYKYLWSDNFGAEKSTPGILFPGTFSCAIIDSNGCQLIKSISIIEPAKIELSFITKPSKCNIATGQAIAIATGGVGNLEYYWEKNTSNNNTLNNITAGEYYVTIIDENACSEFGKVLVEDANGPIINSKVVTPVECHGQGGINGGINNNAGAGGKIEIQVTNGTRPYSYKWSSRETDTINNIADLRAGIYSVKITDAANCITVDSFLVKEPKEFTATVVTTKTPCKASQGSAEVILTGGFTPYKYSWSNSNLKTYKRTNLSAGKGFVTVLDNTGCKTYSDFEIFDSNGPAVTTTILQEEKCFFAAQGSLKANATGGRPPYNYVWYPQGDQAKISTSNIAQGLLGNTYKVVVTDADGCSGQAFANIKSPHKLEVEIDKLSPSTYTENDGAAQSLVFGGVPPYSYQWSNGSQNKFVTGLTKDSTWLRVKDANGCVVTAFSPLNPHPINPPGGGSPCTYTNTPNACVDTSGCPGCYIVTRDITDFGADGTDDISDECAFEKAVSYFSSLDSATIKNLHINEGIYYVGKQDTGLGRLLNGHDVLSFHTVYNLHIYGDVNVKGDPTSILRINPCMYYGVFEPGTMKRLITYNGTDSALAALYCLNANNINSHTATVGDMISINNCNRISIRDLELDGNIDNTVIGGGYSDGLQIGNYAGITLNIALNTQLTNLRVHHFGYDGLTLKDAYCPYPNQNPQSNQSLTNLNLRINSCVFTFNARNNMSWGGGGKIIVNNSEFSHGGQPRFYANPGSGLDIEYESPGQGLGHPASHGRFNNCRFEYNAGFAFVSDANTYNAIDNKFNLCTFIGFNCIKLGAKSVSFSNCNFVGTVASHHNEPVADSIQNLFNHYQTVFTDCDFNEEFNVPGVGRRSFQLGPDESLGGCPVLGEGHGFLINAIGARQEFTRCHTHTNYTMKDGFFHGHDSINLQVFNKIRTRNLGMTNHGLNSCDCDHELSSMVNCNFVGDANGDIVMGGGTTWSGNRNSPHHGGPGEYDVQHFQGHHQYHGVSAGMNISTLNPFDHTQGPFTQVCCYVSLWPIVPKFSFPNYPLQVHDLFTGYAPYMYSTLNGIQSFCLDPIVPKNRYSPTLNSEFNIYPNPATSTVTIKNIIPGSTIKIVNFIGELMIVEKVNYDKREIDIKLFPPGIYLIYVNDLPSKKLIKI